MTQVGCCPECGDLLLHADHAPQSQSQWERCVRATALALRKQSLHCQVPGLMEGIKPRR